jgi:diaminohydroxyphosphoribosylaminopyrimidine deaminase/5-amino-6-(5-phosphoribosylamino)uracil reductase
VVVHEGRILGEGYHQQYGGPHAERHAIHAVPPEDRYLLPHSRLYVSLEPCCHHGKTPPCTDLILSNGIPEVYVSVPDPNPVVGGKGIGILRENGVQVLEGVLAEEGQELIRFFHTYLTKKRPHVILKMVQSRDGFIGYPDKQVWLSNDYERIMVHKMRSEIDAILVGTNTAVIDNPELTTRYYPGRNPLRVIIDRTGRIPETHAIFDGATPTLLFTERNLLELSPRIEVVHCVFKEDLPEMILAELYHRKIQSLLVEGGAQLIATFRDKKLWDEALVVRTPKILEKGIKAPVIEGTLKWRYEMAGDEILAIRAAGC